MREWTHGCLWLRPGRGLCYRKQACRSCAHGRPQGSRCSWGSLASEHEHASKTMKHRSGAPQRRHAAKHSSNAKPTGIAAPHGSKANQHSQRNKITQPTTATEAEQQRLGAQRGRALQRRKARQGNAKQITATPDNAKQSNSEQAAKQCTEPKQQRNASKHISSKSAGTPPP